jgi:hypothetical protein
MSKKKEFVPIENPRQGTSVQICFGCKLGFLYYGTTRLCSTCSTTEAGC